jgi:murein L,D-transpeptidase YafK
MAFHGHGNLSATIQSQECRANFRAWSFAMPGFSRFGRAVVMAAAGLAVLTLASCTEYSGTLPKHLRPLSDEMKQLLSQKGMDDNAPILVRIFKAESTLEVWKQEEASSRYALLKSYHICKWSGELGPKVREGDRQAPEGFYTITPAQMNPNSDYYLSFNLGYPNAYDRSLGRTGAHLMVHGACSSRGCYSMDDEQIQEIYTLARLAFQGGQRDFQVQAYPFRMTPENMAEHRNDENFAFWQMLKEGYDHFEVIRQPPKVDVCARQYVFNEVPEAGMSFSPTAECPPMSVPDPIRIRVAERQVREEEQFIEIVARLDRQGDDGIADRFASAPAAARPASVAAAPPAPEPTTTASVPAPAAAGDTATAAAEPAFLPVPDAPAVANAGETTPAGPTVEERMEATAYAPEPEERGFFSRMISAVNPF